MQVHLIGIGGSGMRPLAQLLLQKGYTVSGSDMKDSESVRALKKMGANVRVGHGVSLVKEAEVVVYSSAISEVNPELVYAKDHGLEILKRAEMLARVMADYAVRIAVAGTHGKTTTTGLMAWVLEQIGQNPSYMVGSSIVNTGHSSNLVKGDIFVTEADESDGSFLDFNPTHAIVTNIEPDHMTYFKTEKSLKSHFLSFMKNVVDAGGSLILNRDDQVVCELSKSLPEDQVYWYSLKDALVGSNTINYSSQGMTASLMCLEQEITLSLSLWGDHQVSNALSVLQLLHLLELPLKDSLSAFETFKGTYRRLEHIGEAHGIDVYDDYAHHPTEIQTTLHGLKRGLDRRLVCVFQPHRYSRFNEQYQAFIAAFDDADVVIVTDVFSAGETQVGQHSVQDFLVDLRAVHSGDVYYFKRKSVSDELFIYLRDRDVVVTMGAGDVTNVSRDIIVSLKQRGMHYS